jgi:hypothetical protein
LSNSFFKRLKKGSDFETEIIARLDLLQVSEARLREDIRQIVREEIKNVLDSCNRKGWWQIA